jgi:hypothetical protein
MSASDSRIIRKPVRTSCWSSAITTRMVMPAFLFYASLLTAVALIVLIVIALFQRGLRSRRART